jgi:heat shock protein 5
MAALIPRNPRVPTSNSKIVTAFRDNEDQVKIQVFESERPRAKGNHLIASFDLIGIKSASCGIPQIEVTFKIDANGLLFLSVEDKATKSKEPITINAQKGRLSESQREETIRKAVEMKNEDEKIRQGTVPRNRLEDFLFAVKGQITDEKAGARVSEEDKEKVREIIEEGMKWLDEHPHDEKDVSTDKFKDLQEVITPLFSEIDAVDAGGAESSDTVASDCGGWRGCFRCGQD